MTGEYQWVLRLPEREHVLQLEKEGGFPPLLAVFLANRGLTNPSRAWSFLYPRLTDFADPFVLPDMPVAVKLLAEALRAGHPIGLYADYDADGVTGAAVLYGFLRALGARVEVLFPHRERDGYGFHPHLVTFFKEKGVRLIVTADCGITSHEAVRAARELGLQVIVTDHHELPSELPPAQAVISGKRLPRDSAFYDLSGVGTVFALVRALRSYLYETGFFGTLSPPNLKRYLDLVALGTVADMVPLRGENRLIAVFGLEELSRTQRPGLRALKEVAGVNGAVGPEEVLFRLAPRINAAGRLSEARLAFELLVCEDEGRAMELARELNRLNAERQRVEEEVLAEAREMLKAFPELPPGLVLYRENWPLGVLGIVAGRLTEEFYRPVVLLTRKGELLKGSGRSIPEVNLFEAFRRCRECLRGFGGHPAAGGVKLAPEDLSAFARTFEKAVEEMTGPVEALRPRLLLEAQVEISQLTEPEFLEGFQRLAPFGPGNPEPVVAVSDFEIRHPRVVGEKHLRFTLWQKGAGLSAIFFRSVDQLANFQDTAGLHLAAVPTITEFQGERYLELKILDLRRKT